MKNANYSRGGFLSCQNNMTNLKMYLSFDTCAKIKCQNIFQISIITFAQRVTLHYTNLS